MDQVEQRRNRVKIAIPVRVRGMSTRNKFFDESTETSLVSKGLVVTRIHSLVDLETELHVVNSKTNQGGTFRVLWVNVQGKHGWHEIGLELIDAEGDLWEIPLTAVEEDSEETAPAAWLQCQWCHESRLTSVPEAEDEYIYDGFLIARPCEQCKATTPWGFTPAQIEERPAAVAQAAAASEGDKQDSQVQKDLRTKGRAPLNIKIKVTRKKYGTSLEEICETINVSRSGAYFLSSQNYEVGEPVKVVLPYQEGDLTIPVPARVVRQEQAKDSFYHAVAIELKKEKS